MVFSTPTVFLSADKAALIKTYVAAPPNPSELPWSPMPQLDERAIELKERREEAKRRLEEERAAAAKRLQLENEISGTSLYGSFRTQRTDQNAPSSSAPMFSLGASSPRRPNLGGALKKLEEASPGMVIPDMEVPAGFAADDSQPEPTRSIGFAGFGQVESNSRHRPRREEKETKENALPERHRRASRSREVTLTCLNTQVFGN
ncbi:MAG: hypothetical protein ACI38Q_07940 [Candidatus Bruticola sp.]